MQEDHKNSFQENPLDIKMVFKNYKAVGTKTFELNPEHNIYLFKGNNKQGKTSILDAIISVYNARSKADTPLSFDSIEKDGSVTLHGFPGPNNNTYTFNWIFNDKGNNKFYFINEQTGDKVSSVKKIREFFQVSDMTAEEIFFKAQSAPGRREIIKLIEKIIEKIDPEKYEQIKHLKDITDNRTGSLFLQRKDANEKAESFKYNEPKEPDNKIMDNKQKILDVYDELKNKKEKYLEESEIIKESKAQLSETSTKITFYDYKISENEQAIETFKSDIEEIDDQIAKLQEKRKAKEEQILATKTGISKMKGEKQLLQKEEEKLQEEVNIETEWTEEDEEKLEKGEKFVKRIEEEERNEREYSHWENEKAKAIQEKIEAENKLTEARNKLSSLFSQVDLPFNIYIEEDDIYINDMLIDTSNQSRAEMKIMAALILIYYNNAPIIVMGEAHDFDAKSLKILNDLLEQTGYKMFMDEVVREKTDDIKIIGIDQTNFETLK